MTAENNEMGDYPDDDYSDDDSLAADQLPDEEYEDDQEFEDQEFADDQRSSESRKSRSKKKRRMFCGGCNRMENHRRAARKSWLNSYVTGLTFGLNHIVGPFKCSCCGSNRWIFRLKKSNAVIVKSKR